MVVDQLDLPGMGDSQTFSISIASWRSSTRLESIWSLGRRTYLP